MSIEATSGHLSALASARRAADDDIERAINSLRVAYKQVVDAAEAAAALNAGTTRSSSAPMSELVDYLATAREALAEITLALIELHPKQAGNLGVSHPIPVSFAADARKGMQSKRLAKWETEALRELVVEALAGEAEAGQ